MIKRICGIIAIVILAANSVFASLFIGADNKSLHPQEIYNDDMYLTGNSIRFQSHIIGDLVGASQELVFSGQADNNISWAARFITVNGTVQGTVRGFAQKIDINAPIGRNLVALGQRVLKLIPGI